MGLLYGAMGGLSGLMLQLYANGVRNMPMMYQPWLHVMWVGAGVYGGVKYEQFEIDNKEALDEKHRQLHRPPRPAVVVPPRSLY